MKLITALKNTIIGLYKSIKRFPATIGFSALTSTMLIVISENQKYLNRSAIDTLSRIAMIFALGIPVSLCIKVVLEKKEFKNSIKAGIYLLGVAFLLLYYFFLLDKFEMVEITRYIATNIALYLAFIYIPYTKKKGVFELYVMKVLSRFFITFIYSGILFLGLSAILFTIDKLLGVRIYGNTYYYTWLIVAGVFAPSFFLAGIPLRDAVMDEDKYPNLFKVLLLYIIVPIITVYTAILYVYFAKIIITTQWPIGLVSHLVLWYSVITIGVIFFIAPIIKINTLANKFTLWFPKIIIPIIIMMFLSIGIRIRAFGITENRYYVVVLALWVLGIMLYFNLAKKKRNIIIPITLSIITLVSVYGPFSSYSVSKFSQNKRFQGILVRNAMLKEGKIQKAPSSIASRDKREISRIIDYFMNNHNIKDLKYIPDNFKVNDMEKVFGFPYDNVAYAEPNGYFFLNRSQSNNTYDIRGYDYLFDSRSIKNEDKIDKNAIRVKYDMPDSVIKIIENNSEIYTLDVKAFVKDLIEKYGANAKEEFVNPEDMTLENENSKIKVKIIFMNISGSKNISSENLEIHGMEFYMLIKVK